MYDIKPLEEEWKKYNKKKKRPWYILGIVVLLLSIIPLVTLKYSVVNLFKFDNKNNIEKKDKEITVTKITSVLVDKALSKLELKKPKENIFTEITEIKPKTVTSNNNPMDISKNIDVLEDVKKIKKPKVKIKTKVVKKPRKKMHLNIIKTTSVSAYKDVEKRFYESHDSDDSLFLAKSYYSRGNYKKAEHWARETNKVNRNIEESWLIFAKSKVKLGHKNEAIRILMSYVKKSESQKAKRLLRKIKKGTL